MALGSDSYMTRMMSRFKPRDYAPPDARELSLTIMERAATSPNKVPDLFLYECSFFISCRTLFFTVIIVMILKLAIHTFWRKNVRS